MNDGGRDVAPYRGVQVAIHPPAPDAAGEIDLVGSMPGPAGLSAIDLGDGATVTVDFASPSQLCSIHAPVSSLSAGHDDVLGRLVDTDGLAAIGDAMSSLSKRAITFTFGERDYWRQASSYPAGLGPTLFGASLSALAVGSDADEAPTVRAAALVESMADMLAQWPLHSVAVDLHRVDSWMSRAAEVLEADGAEVLAQLAPDEYRTLFEAVRRIISYTGTGVPWARALVRAVPGTLEDRLAASPSTRGTIDEAHLLRAAEPAFARVDRDDPVVLPTQPQMTMMSPGRLVLDFTHRPRGAWVRVIDRGSLALMAIAPIARDGRRWTAEAVLDSDTGISDVTFEVSDQPLGMPAESSADRIVAAVESGRHATLLAARGRREAATEEWLVCAQMWRQMGDETRANLADAYAVGGRRPERQWRVHDAIRELVED